MIGLVFALALAVTAPDLLSRMVETPDLAAPSLSPDGRQVVYRRIQANLATDAYRLSWWTVPSSGGPARRLCDAGQPIWRSSGLRLDEPAIWSADGRFIYYRAEQDGEVQVWRARLADGRAEPVTHDAADVERFALAGDRRLVYQVGATRAAIAAATALESAEGVRLDASVDVAANLLQTGWRDGRLTPLRFGGAWFDHVQLLDQTPRMVRTIDLANLTVAADGATAGDRAALSTGADAPDHAADAFGAIAETVAEVNGAVKVTLGSTGAARILAVPRPDQRIVRLAWRPGRGRRELIVFTRDAANNESLFVWRLNPERPQLGGLQVRAAANGLLSGGPAAEPPCALGETAAICIAASALRPPRLVRVDLDTGALRDLDVPAPAPPAGEALQARPLSWLDARGRKFTGVLLTSRARPAGPPPLFITYYSCEGYLRGGVGDEQPLAAMAAAGLSSLCINKLPQAPGTPYRATEAYDAALAGVRAIVGQLAAQGMADPHRVGMGGLSFGSEVTMWIATHSDLLTAVSISSPQVAPDYYWFNSAAGRPQPETLKAAWGLGDPEQDPTAWRRVSPALQVEALKAPVLMQLSEGEFRYEMELYAKLSHTRTPVDMFIYPAEPHLKTDPGHRLAIYRRNLAWFETWLDLDEAAPDQDAIRWRGLRARIAAERQIPAGVPRGSARLVQTKAAAGLEP